MKGHKGGRTKARQETLMALTHGIVVRITDHRREIVRSRAVLLLITDAIVSLSTDQ